ncbi:MAG: deoxycytidine triphosphate deaminase [Gammaproteobacteria bacterium]|nr:deoxycytidine triphosphate deaminase [Gammaproteobacteria bacterium]OUU08108.1 MAG: deoxycytidine triphosphate deaminase [Gammaproteobacteria bacterium TMED34]|tara:strand:+ start:72 stop:374 length:303 start_codon:yes stop_codon:yes gene_type:complete
MDTQTKTEIEAAAFRRLLEHLDENKEVQNIDLMNLAGFCRNCLSKWYLAAAEDKGIELDYEGAREVVYGEPYSDWKKKYQGEASAEQKAAFDAKSTDHKY